MFSLGEISVCSCLLVLCKRQVKKPVLCSAGCRLVLSIVDSSVADKYKYDSYNCKKLTTNKQSLHQYKLDGVAR